MLKCFILTFLINFVLSGGPIEITTEDPNEESTHSSDRFDSETQTTNSVTPQNQEINCERPEQIFDPNGKYLTTACAIFKAVTLPEAVQTCKERGMQMLDGHNPLKVKALDQLKSVRAFTSPFWTIAKSPKCYALQKLRAFTLIECNCVIIQLVMCEFQELLLDS